MFLAGFTIFLAADVLATTFLIGLFTFFVTTLILVLFTVDLAEFFLAAGFADAFLATSFLPAFLSGLLFFFVAVFFTDETFFLFDISPKFSEIYKFLTRKQIEIK
ncbi:MAG: hypothetical protein H0U95_05885 [Bacteroidetes bacterium]|nr:hypothetical protein [Bacteroidota bacterium]